MENAQNIFKLASESIENHFKASLSISALNEFAQKASIKPPDYRPLQTDSKHKNLFGMELFILGQQFTVQAELSSKQDAKKICALKAVEYLSNPSLNIPYFTEKGSDYLNLLNPLAQSAGISPPTFSFNDAGFVESPWRNSSRKVPSYTCTLAFNNTTFTSTPSTKKILAKEDAARIAFYGVCGDPKISSKLLHSGKINLTATASVTHSTVDANAALDTYLKSIRLHYPRSQAHLVPIALASYIPIASSSTIATTPADVSSIPAAVSSITPTSSPTIEPITKKAKTFHDLAPESIQAPPSSISISSTQAPEKKDNSQATLLALFSANKMLGRPFYNYRPVVAEHGGGAGFRAQLIMGDRVKLSGEHATRTEAAEQVAAMMIAEMQELGLVDAVSHGADVEEEKRDVGVLVDVVGGEEGEVIEERSEDKDVVVLSSDHAAIAASSSDPAALVASSSDPAALVAAPAENAEIGKHDVAVVESLSEVVLCPPQANAALLKTNHPLPAMKLVQDRPYQHQELAPHINQELASHENHKLAPHQNQELASQQKLALHQHPDVSNPTTTSSVLDPEGYHSDPETTIPSYHHLVTNLCTAQSALPPTHYFVPGPRGGVFCVASMLIPVTQDVETMTSLREHRTKGGAVEDVMHDLYILLRSVYKYGLANRK